MQKEMLLKNGRLDFVHLEALEAQCRRQRSEAIFNSLSNLIKRAPQWLAALTAWRFATGSRTAATSNGASAR
jgi:hypothetical protein